MYALVRNSVVCVSLVGHENTSRLTQHALNNSVTVSLQSQSVELEVAHYTEEEEGILWFIVLNG